MTWCILVKEILKSWFCSSGLSVFTGRNVSSLQSSSISPEFRFPQSPWLINAYDNLNINDQETGLTAHCSLVVLFSVIVHWNENLHPQIWGHVLSWRRVEWRTSSISILLTRENKVEWKIYTWIGVVWTLLWSFVVKWEVSIKVKFLIYQLIYVPILTYGHEVWVVTKRMKMVGNENSQTLL